MTYNFNAIERKWQEYWKTNRTFQAVNPGSNSTDKAEPYYVLDMFPYPSGAGLHVGHPLGYIASDILARYKRHQGFNVLHPMGYDSFGLPAEQYAIQTGQHPAITTETNINRYREQLDNIGFSFDWSREVRTSNPDYYKWTQWIFCQLFDSWYDTEQDKARSISDLIKIFESTGNQAVKASCDELTPQFSAEEWKAFSPKEQADILLNYRLTYLAETEVNWCPQLGTVLANDEIVNGVSERGGYPVERKKMKQWSMRITAYAERLLQGLNKLDWSESLKETQRNWIGKSKGAEVEFNVLPTEEPALNKLIEEAEESDYLFKKAEERQQNPTEVEDLVWTELKNRNLGADFKHHQVIGGFIVNFVSYSKKIIIEIDRKVYETSDEYIEKRTALLTQQGFKVLHFENDYTKANLQAVIKVIKTTIAVQKSTQIRVFTTRPDTIFGVSYMTLAPEHELVSTLTTATQREAVETYIEQTAKRSERERQADKNSITGVFTGAYAEHPITKKPIPIWIGDYVLASYGTGAVMAVPAGDERDYKFAKHFEGQKGMPAIPAIFDLEKDNDTPFFSRKKGYTYKNSDFLNGLTYREGLAKILDKLHTLDQGRGTINYRLRDAVFSRQRYWGEPFPVYYKNNTPHLIPEECLPLQLPEVEKYLPTKDGQPPLGRASTWHWDENRQKVVRLDDTTKSSDQVYPLELNTMPGWAGSSWYFLRYMENTERDTVFASQKAMDYWKHVDLYIGGSEHATGHLLYARFWTKFLNDRKLTKADEPFQKLINQGMILGESAFVHRLGFELAKEPIGSPILAKTFIDQYHQKLYASYHLVSPEEADNQSFKQLREILKSTFPAFAEIIDNLNISLHKIHANVTYVNTSNELDIDNFKSWRPEFNDAELLTDGSGKFTVSREVEKMSKSKFNVVNPDDICEEYGADTLRLYEMFLGPIDQAKPWSTAGLSGVHGFLKKLWRLYFDQPQDPEATAKFKVSNMPASKEELKILHKTIKKVTADIEHFSFNTAVSSLMICVKELTSLNCQSREVLEPLTVLVAPYAPHIAEELWEMLGHQSSVSKAAFPLFDEKHLKETTKEYPISFNGKKRFTLELPLDLSKDEIEEKVMTDERTLKRLDGRQPKKVIIIPGKIINIVG